MLTAKRILVSLVLTQLFLCLGPADAATTRDSLLGQDDIPYGAAADYLIGRQLLKEGQYAEALGYLHLVYRTHPDVPAIAIDFQEALVAEGYFQDALGVMDRLIASNPDSLSYLLQRSNLNIQLGHQDLALADLREIRQKGGANLEVIMAEANLLAGQDKTNQAMDVYRDGMLLLPEQGDQIYLGMASLLQKDGQMDEVAPLMAQAVKDYPDTPQLWLVWMRALALTKQDDQAIATAQMADERFLARTTASSSPETEIAGEDVPPAAHAHPESFLVELADFYVQQGQVARAVGILQQMSEADQLDVTPSLWLARIYLATGQGQLAENLVEKVVARWPNSARGWFLKGKILENQGLWAETIPHFKKAAVLGPRDPEIRIALVRAMLVGWEADIAAKEPTEAQREKRDQLEKHAVAALTLVIDQDTDGHLVLGYAFRRLADPWRAEASFAKAAANPEIRISAITQRSLCLDEMGDQEKARRVLEDLHTEFPQHPEVANSLGYFLAEKGLDLKKAETLIQIALDSDPGNGAFLDSMGWVLYRQGKVESAFDFMIQAVNVLPDDPVILEHLGMVLIGMGQAQEGSEMLRRSLAMGGDQARLESVLADLDKKSQETDSSELAPRRP